MAMSWELFKYKHTFVQYQLERLSKKHPWIFQTRKSLEAIMINFPVPILMHSYQYLKAFGLWFWIASRPMHNMKNLKGIFLSLSQDISSFDVVASSEEWKKRRMWCVNFWCGQVFNSFFFTTVFDLVFSWVTDLKICFLWVSMWVVIALFA